jgi:HEPN domain-containing protein
MVHKLVILRWLYKADQDFGFARSSLLDRGVTFYDQICFHFQQAAENILKPTWSNLNYLSKKNII